MPVPTPRKGESEKDFIHRCMGAIGGEKDAIGICYGQWNSKMTGRIADVRRVLQLPMRQVEGKPGRVKSYAAIWGDEDHPDWYGTWFTRETDFALDWYNQRPWLYDHSMNSFVRTAKIGDWKDADLDEHGLFFMGELDKHFHYLDEVEYLMELGWLFPSSGTLSHVMQVADDGWIRRWPIAELSSTTSPAEFRIPAQQMKASHRRRAVEAIRRLGGLTMSEENGSVATALFPGVTLQQTDPPTEPVAPARATEDEDTIEPEVDAAVEDTAPGEGSEIDEEVETTEEPVLPELAFGQIETAILSIDEVVRSLAEQVERLAGRLDALEQPPARQVSDLVADQHWTDRLFCATRSGRAITNEDVGNEDNPQGPLSESDALLAQLGSIQGPPEPGQDILGRIVASQQ